MKYIINENHYNLPDEALLADLRKAAKKLGRRSLTNTEYRLEGRFAATTIMRRFGSWNNALKKAGLSINVLRGISKGELFLNLKHVWNSLKRQPHLSDMFPPLSQYSGTCYTKRFGSWRGALKAFVRYAQKGGHVIIRPKKRNREKYLKILRKSVGKSLRYEVMERDDFTCVNCGRSPATVKGLVLHVDHIKPRCKGGLTIKSNLQTLCSDCNIGKSGKLPKNQKKVTAIRKQ